MTSGRLPLFMLDLLVPIVSKLVSIVPIPDPVSMLKAVSVARTMSAEAPSTKLTSSFVVVNAAVALDVVIENLSAV